MMTLAPGSTAWAAGARLRPATRTVPVAATAPVTVRRKGMVLLCGCPRSEVARPLRESDERPHVRFATPAPEGSLDNKWGTFGFSAQVGRPADTCRPHGIHGSGPRPGEGRGPLVAPGQASGCSRGSGVASTPASLRWASVIGAGASVSGSTPPPDLGKAM